MCLLTDEDEECDDDDCKTELMLLVDKARLLCEGGSIRLIDDDDDGDDGLRIFESCRIENGRFVPLVGDGCCFGRDCKGFALILCLVDGASGLNDWTTGFVEGTTSSCVGSMARLSLHETEEEVVDLTRFVKHGIEVAAELFSSFSSYITSFRFVEASAVDFDSEVKSIIIDGQLVLFKQLYETKLGA